MHSNLCINREDQRDTCIRYVFSWLMFEYKHIKPEIYTLCDVLFVDVEIQPFLFSIIYALLLCVFYTVFFFGHAQLFH